jgi:hypothetical protein
MKYTKTIRASKKSSAPRSVKASARARRAVKAEDEIEKIDEVKEDGSLIISCRETET